jgi:hypothetical protein
MGEKSPLIPDPLGSGTSSKHNGSGISLLVLVNKRVAYDPASLALGLGN